METEIDQECDYDDIIETLMCMFGDVLSKDVIKTIVESCGGDLNLAADAVMNITSDVNNATDESEFYSVNSSSQSEERVLGANIPVAVQQLQLPRSGTISPSVATTSEPIKSYASLAGRTGAIPKQNSPKHTNPTFLWTDQIRRIVGYHNQGSRTLILMRGLPGSGKSYLARQIVEIMIGSSQDDIRTHVYSTDDFFYCGGVYRYELFKLREAHEWNQTRVSAALNSGLSPVIVDNTNVEMWEMEIYLRYGVNNGYIIEVVEPNTPWAKKANQLLYRNRHDVPLQKIKKMLTNYVNGVTGDVLIKYYNLSYPPNMLPPVLRKFPQIVLPNDSEKEITKQNTESGQSALNSLTLKEKNHKGEPVSTNVTKDPQISEELEKQVALIDINPSTESKNKSIITQMEEFERVELEWENGETWDETSTKTESCNTGIQAPLLPKPPRRDVDDIDKEELINNAGLLESVQNCDDWSKITMLMPPLQESAVPNLLESEENCIDTRSSSTCMEMGDTVLQNAKQMYKIVSAVPRDINIFHFSPTRDKIPSKRMLDKSTMTNDQTILDTNRCKNEKHHFIAFRKLFKNIPKVVLKDIFDKCCGDVNWAVDIVLDGMSSNDLQTTNDENISDEEVEDHEQCTCLATYDVVPDTASIATENCNQKPVSEPTPTTSYAQQKKTKSELSHSSIQLKRQIEKNVVISDNHYSEHCLKIRKMRRGEYDSSNDVVGTDQPHDTANEAHPVDNSQECNIEHTSADGSSSSDDEVSNASFDENEETVNINLGTEFITHLDNCLGRSGVTYPWEDVVPKINIPKSRLVEIHAFWMESLMSQLDEIDKQKERMIKEDEEIARQLEMKEAEMAKLGKEPEVPDFKEIMDMDFALSLYQKDMAEWKSKEPNDMAARMTRDKLYNLFPDTSPHTLAEVLMAHDNNFKATVEVLLVSTGQSEILQEPNGLNKFVMRKELERQEKLIEIERKALSEVEWPFLPKGEKVVMATVQQYRQEAENHLLRRNMNYEKAQEYIRRGMTQVANYFNDVALFHKQKYEHANSRAAASLMQVHALNSPNSLTMDLHFLRVNEAKEALDIFIDTHIQKLKEPQNKRIRFHSLFFITGRGLHSNGKPRIKPAIKRRLKERGLLVIERNPGLLNTRVCAYDKLSYQVQAP